MADSRNSRGSGQMTTHNSDQLLDMLRQEVMSQGSDRPGGHRNKGAVQDSLDTYRSVNVDLSSDEEREEHYPVDSPGQNHLHSRDSPHLPYQPKGYSHDRNVTSESDRYTVSTSQQTTRPHRTVPGSVQRAVRQLGNSDDDNDDDEHVRDSLDDEEDDLAEEENYQQQLKERLKQEQEQMQSDDILEDGEESPSDSLDLPAVQHGGGHNSDHSPLSIDTRGSDRYEDLERGSQTPSKDPYANLRYDPNWKERGALIVSTPYVQEELQARTRMVDFEQDFFPSDSLESADKNTLRLGTPHPTRDMDNSREASRESQDSRYTLQTESDAQSVSRGSSDDRMPVRDHKGGNQRYSSPEEDDTSEREEIRGYQRALKVGEPRVVPYNKPFPSPPQAPYAQQPTLNTYHWPPAGEEEESGYQSKKDSQHKPKKQHRPVGPVGYTSPRAVGPVVQKAAMPEEFEQSHSPNDDYNTSSDVTITSSMTNQRQPVEKPPLPRPPKTEKPPPKSFIELNKENLNRQDAKKGGSYARRYAQKKALNEQPPSARRQKAGKSEVSEPSLDDTDDFSNMTAEEVWQLKQERLRQAKEAKSGVKSGKKPKHQKTTRTDASPPSKASSASSTASKNSQASQESMELRSISQTTTQVDAPPVRIQGAPQHSPRDAGYQSQALPPQMNQSTQGLYPEGVQTSPHAYHPVQQPMYAFPSQQAPINVNINLSFDPNEISPKQAGNRVSPRVTVDTEGRQDSHPDFPDTKHHSPDGHRQDNSPHRGGYQDYNTTHGPPEEMGSYGPRSPESHRSHPQTRPRQLRKETAYTTLSDPTDKSTRQYRRERTYSKPAEVEEGYGYDSEPVQGSYAQIHQAERRLMQEEQQHRQRSLPGSGVREPYQGAYTGHQERPDQREGWPHRGEEYDDPFNSSQEYEEGPHTYVELHAARRAQEESQHQVSPRGSHNKVQQHPGPHYRTQGPPQHHGPHDRSHGPAQHHGPHDRSHGPAQHHGPHERPHGPSQHHGPRYGPPEHHGPHDRITQRHQAPDYSPQQHGHAAWHADPHQPPHPHFPPYLRNVGRRSSEGDIADFYQQDGVRRESFSPYSKIPPIGPQEERKAAKNTINHANKQTLKAKSNSEGYLASYAKSKAMAKKKPQTYKPYTMKDYNNLKKDTRLGGLGPDLERVQDKTEKARRQKEYANTLREQHAKQKADWQKKRDVQPYYPQDDEGDFYSKREVQEVEEEDDAQKRRKRALQYAKSVPKPKPAPLPKAVTVLETHQHPDTIPYHPPPAENHQPNIMKIEREDSAQPAPSPVLSEIQKMRMRHEKDRANAEAIRRNMGSKVQGVVDS
ncbi:uncharacterized protein LOC144912399 isoform X4 [Branchiostoma floridae x Branchiostoma belcheri]